MIFTQFDGQCNFEQTDKLEIVHNFSTNDKKIIIF